MRLFLHPIKLSEHEDADINIFSILLKFFLIASIALLVFFLTARTYAPASMADKQENIPGIVQNSPPAPY